MLCCAGSLVKAGQKLAVLSAMKMETAVQSPCDGLVRHVGVDKGDSLEAGKSSGPSSVVLQTSPLACMTVWQLHTSTHVGLHIAHKKTLCN